MPSSEQSKKKIYKTIPFTTTSKRKNIKNKLNQGGKRLYTEKCKTLLKD